MNDSNLSGFNAKVARGLTAAVPPKDLLLVLDAVKRSAKNGNQSVVWKNYLEPATIQELKNRGFIVHDWFEWYHNHNYAIYW